MVDDVTRSLLGKPADGGQTPTARPRRTARVKTRFLNFKYADKQHDHAASDAGTPDAEMPAHEGVLAGFTIVEGPGRGTTLLIQKPYVEIGRADSQDIKLDFGDDSVSRECHASIAYYGAQIGFVVRDGIKPNPLLLNGVTVMGEKPIKHGDLLTVGETKLRFRSA